MTAPDIASQSGENASVALGLSDHEHQRILGSVWHLEYIALRLVPTTLAEANAFVGEEHRHHGPTVGHKFSVGVADHNGVLRGVAIAGRPVARGHDHKTVLEVTRLATDGSKNACSILYAAVARAACALGYRRQDVITYTLASEPGTSLRAAGWVLDGEVKGRSWDTPSRRRTDSHPTVDKLRWRAA